MLPQPDGHRDFIANGIEVVQRSVHEGGQAESSTHGWPERARREWCRRGHGQWGHPRRRSQCAMRLGFAIPFIHIVPHAIVSPQPQCKPTDQPSWKGRVRSAQNWALLSLRSDW